MPETLEMSADETAYFESGGENVSDALVAETPEIVETPETPETAAPEADDKTKTVPHSALHEERQRRKAAQEEARAEREARAKLTGRMEILEQLARQQPQQQAPEMPPLDQDPVAHVAQHGTEIAELRKWKLQQEQQTAQQAQMQQFASAITTREQAFARENPDYFEAVGFAQSRRHEDLLEMGMSPEQAAQVVQREAIMIAQNAFQSGKNPAEVAYSLAKRWGYQKPAPKVDAGEKLANLAQRQTQHKSLSNASGGGAPKSSLESLLDMSDEDFMEATKGDKWRKLLTA